MSEENMIVRLMKFSFPLHVVVRGVSTYTYEYTGRSTLPEMKKGAGQLYNLPSLAILRGGLLLLPLLLNLPDRALDLELDLRVLERHAQLIPDFPRQEDLLPWLGAFVARRLLVASGFLR